MIVGRYQRQSLALDEPAADLLAVFSVTVVEDDLAIIAFGRGDLRRRRIRRHDNRRWNVQKLGRQGDALRVIAGGKRHDAPAALFGIEFRQRIERAAEFERAHPLEVFALEEQFGAELQVRRARGQNRRTMRLTVNPGRCGQHVVIGWKGLHVSSPWRGSVKRPRSKPRETPSAE